MYVRVFDKSDAILYLKLIFLPTLKDFFFKTGNALLDTRLYISNAYKFMAFCLLSSKSSEST